MGQHQKTFSQGSGLVKHWLTYSYRREATHFSHEYLQYQNAFSQKNDLVRHMNTHTRKKPHHCYTMPEFYHGELFDKANECSYKREATYMFTEILLPEKYCSESHYNRRYKKGK